MADQKRFASLSEDDFSKIIDNKDAAQTKKATIQSVKILREYLNEKRMNDQFETYAKEDLDLTLGKFYTETRKQNGEFYKRTSFSAIRHGINRHMSSKCDIDIINDSSFKKSNEAFLAMNVELKRQGAGGIEHYPPIDNADLQKLYLSFDLSDPESLQHKVFVDIMLHFGRRGRENLRQLLVTDFALTTGANGMRYIYLKRDELTKNHQLDTNTADGRMYEVESQDERCPLKTFVKYKRMLPPGNTYLFPRVLKTATKSGYYFSMQPIGQNKLGTMMSNLSIKAGLSQKYTNHSLRATSVHVLDSAQVPTRHIMSVTGHKCENSLKTYTGFTDSSTKQMMSHTISKSLGLNVNSENKENSMDVQNSNTALNTIESLSIGKDELEEFAPTEDSEMDIGYFDVFDDVQFDDLIRSMEVPNENEFIANNLGDSHRHNLQTLQNQNQTVQAMRQSTDINMGQNQNQTVQAMRQSTDINMGQNQNQTVQAMRQSTDINMGHSRPTDINMRHISDINMRQTFNNPRFGLSAPTISNCNVTYLSSYRLGQY